MKQLCVCFCLAFVGSCVSGCGSSLFNQHVKDQEIMRALAMQASSRLSESGTGQTAGGVQGINPGIRVEAGLSYYAVAKYDGLAGQLTFAQQGSLGRTVAPEDAALIREIANDTSISQAEKRRMIMELLGKVADRLLAPPATQPNGP